MEYVIETRHLGEFTFPAHAVTDLVVSPEGVLWVHHHENPYGGEGFAPTTWTRWYLRDREGAVLEETKNETA